MNYEAARLHPKIKNIKVPTLALNAEDDPFQPGDSIPYIGAQNSSHMAIMTTKYGGHIGFMEGTIPSRYFYSDRVFSQYLQAIISNQEQIKQWEYQIMLIWRCKTLRRTNNGSKE